ncbi:MULTISPECIES: type VII secretion protein EccCb [Mycobacteriaceae]|uniref:Type VII secretion protein EccCb n=1 Tax=Mycolicibacterium parafortuitum TaxID=39692 RepID=A0ACC6MHS4_MYCPF|nr:MULTISPECIES: type VII secretion protein EccCb [Mycobacteriaceae]MDZ5086457.1 type VII secretion protein EccCb [Mycolicibacterium parafortuitum]
MEHTETPRSRPPPGQLVIDPPPEVPRTPPPNPMARLLPVVMIVAVAGMSAVYLTSGAPRSPTFLLFPVMMAVSLVGTLVYGARGAGRGAEINAQRAEYLRYLDTVHATLAESADQEHRRLHRAHPEPAALWNLAGGDRMWERGPAHPDHLTARIGVGEGPCATTVVAPRTPPAGAADPVTVAAVHELVRRWSLSRGVPVLLRLNDSRSMSVEGEPAAARSVARALLCQLAMLHAPHDLGVTALLDDAAAPHWDWLKWLPHTRDPDAASHRVLLVDGAAEPPAAPGCTVVVLHATEPAAAPTIRVDGVVYQVALDVLALPDATACARRIAGSADAAPGRQAGAGRAPDWPALMGIEDPAGIDVDQVWGARLTAPIGVAADGAPLHLDIKEAAAGGMGPHGLCVGATGSGKSEFLRTLALGMIAAHSPESLNLVLIDFKGGATFLGMDTVQHVSAVITNLADEAPLVARMRDALTGEINRRQELLRAAGNATDIGQYQRMWERDRSMAALPALFIVVDEFSELLSQHPDFIDVFVAIGRLGRSLGMHLLLASQRLDEGRLRGLETHLSYRICLKTFSAAESRAVIGIADAHHLPPDPGAGYLKTADGRLTRFHTAFVSGPHLSVVRREGPVAVRRFTLADTASPPAPASANSSRPLLEVVLHALAGRGPAAHRIWLPPLHRAPPLPALLAATPAAPLRAPVGIVDSPFEQRYDPLLVDVSGATGHVAVVGAPRSGKSTALATVITALAATHDAAQMQFYCLDFGGGALGAVAGLPHVGSVATRAEADLCRRTVAVLESLLRARESAMRRLGLTSFAEYRRRAAAEPDSVDDPYGDVFLVVDGWAVLRQEFDGLDSAITAIAAQGLAFGVHVMLSTARWADFRPALKDQIGTRIELRLGDPADSEMDRRRARELTTRPPGRGLTRDGKEMLLALPDATAVRRPSDTGRARPVEVLPALIPHHRIDRRGDVVLGLGERELAPITIDFDRHPHLLVLGDGECGKTAALRLLCTELIRTAEPSSARIELVDYRRTLLGVVETAHLGGYSVSGPALSARMATLSAQLDARMPDETVTQQQLRDRSWWDGPDIFVVVDDYDLVAGATGNPLTPLADYLPHAKDLGLHLIVARRSGGAARAMFDPVLARLRDMGCSGLMMSAGPDEGVLLGSTRPTLQPPGRGTLLVRGRADELIQLGWVPPP